MHAPANAHCSNCDTPLVGEYCHGCGQSSHNPVRSFGHAVEEVFESFWHLDGKIFRTLRQLLHPGVLAIDYLAGRRARYVPPMRLFVVLCALAFFVGTFTLKIQAGAADAQVQAEVQKALAEGGARLPPEAARAVGPELERIVEHQVEGAAARLAGPGATERLRSGFMRSLSKLMLVLAPAFALLLKLVYRNRQRLYLEHLVVALYSHAFICLVLLVQFCLQPLRELAADSLFATPLETLALLLWAWVPVYLLWMQQRVYGGAWLATLGRYLVLGGAHLALVVCGTLAMLLLSAAQL